jgi:hypothetical protein
MANNEHAPDSICRCWENWAIAQHWKSCCLVGRHRGGGTVFDISNGNIDQEGKFLAMVSDMLTQLINFGYYIAFVDEAGLRALEFQLEFAIHKSLGCYICDSLAWIFWKSFAIYCHPAIKVCVSLCAGTRGGHPFFDQRLPESHESRLFLFLKMYESGGMLIMGSKCAMVIGSL